MTYTYDADGHVTQRSDTIDNQSAGMTKWTYDALGRVTQEVQSGGALPADSVQFTYNAAGQLAGIARFADAAGTQAVAATTMTFDPVGRPTGLLSTHGSTTLADYTVGYNADGQVNSLTTADGQTTYTYDTNGRITGASGGAGPNETFTYDAGGNRTGAGIQISPGNTLASDAAFTYTYDANGNRISQTSKSTGAVTTYTYDDRNRLTGAVTKTAAGAVSETVSYAYDLLDRLIATAVTQGTGPTVPTYNVYDGASIAYQFSSGRTDRALVGPAVDQVLADSASTGAVAWYLADENNTVRDVIDNTGAALDHIVYGAFGNIASETHPAVTLLGAFEGQPLDRATGLELIGPRAYDPAAGLFLQPDAAGFNGGDANLYVFDGADPVDAADPGQTLASRPSSRSILVFGLSHPLGPLHGGS
jgi:RHS repeat-associated protein